MSYLQSIKVQAVQHLRVTITAQVDDEVVVLLVLVNCMEIEKPFGRVGPVNMSGAPLHNVKQCLQAEHIFSNLYLYYIPFAKV